MAEPRPSVALPQGRVIGIQLKNDFPQPIDAFLGIPYAQPPVGDLRFRPALKVPHAPSTTIDASKYGPIAPGKALIQTGPQLKQSEDCLTANVFRPSSPNGTVDREHEANKALPVAIYIHGGAFNRGSAASHNTSSMVAWFAQPFIAVSFGYRLGALGFLPSTVTKNEGALNLGLRDQVLLMEWVQENIPFFCSKCCYARWPIGHHLLNYSETNPSKPRFHRVIIESGAPTFRAVRPYNAAIHEAQFRDFLKQLGASKLSEIDIFPFLRALPTETITSAQTAVFDKYNPSLRWAFQPVIDNLNDLIPRAHLESWTKGLCHIVPILTGFTTNEGTMYVANIDSPSAFQAFWTNLLPALSTHGLGSQYKRLEAAYAHYACVAPVRQTAHFASSQNPGGIWLYHWALPRTVVGRANHGDNMFYETYDAEITGISPTQRELSGVLHAYLTSFIVAGDPNAVRGWYGDRPVWGVYKAERPGVLGFGEGIGELVGGGNEGAVAMFVDDAWAREQTRFWWGRVGVSQVG
ncbi:Carboxylic ester hydrolase [Aspergillus mulundensis]|uniref:Carboxylic ester hydrolase n=1 Tax=Aspergillus mulundensis TaxID=1810919 RepID=A0A3D8RRM0_9EURO|nr:Carboxylic ester hydrolase [Aspergillus mulundensis]RDW76514.1 Carboxylic ester hydrolase [Aspergillus mulundensis]